MGSPELEGKSLPVTATLFSSQPKNSQRISWDRIQTCEKPETKLSAQKCHKPSGSCVNQWLHCCLENKLHESVWQCRCLTAILYHNIMVAVTVGKTILFLIFLHSSFNVIDANCEWEIWWWRLSSFFFLGEMRKMDLNVFCVLLHRHQVFLGGQN